MENPTIVVLTDRNDLDDQLFGTFARCRDLLRQPPVQAADRADLRAKLTVAAGGVVFTTIQKFFPEEKGDRHPVLSDAAQHRRHRRRGAPQPVRLHRRFRAAHARRAAERVVHRLHRHAHREGRRQHARRVRRLHQRLRHPARGGRRRDRADLLREPPGEARADRRRSGQGSTRSSRRRPKAKKSSARRSSRASGRSSKRWSAQRSGSSSIARDLVEHFEKRCEAMDGKAMVVVMSRRICVELYQRDRSRCGRSGTATMTTQGALKVVMTGSASDPLDWQPHIRNKPRREALAQRFRDPTDPFRIVIVRDMWLTGFDCAEPAHDVRGQADARPWADAGHRAGEPRVQGQARRPRRGLPGSRRRAEEGACDLHRGWRHRRDGARPERSRGADAGEVRGLLRPLPRLRLGRAGSQARRRQRLVAAAGGAGAHPRAGGRQERVCSAP